MDQYPMTASDTFVSAGGQGQPYTTTGWNMAGSNSMILPASMTFNSSSVQEFEVQLPRARLDYVDILLQGTLSNVAWVAASDLPNKYITDYITKLQITDNLKNIPVDVSDVEIRALLAVTAPTDRPIVSNLVKLNTLTPASGAVTIKQWIRIWGPFQLAAMARPVIKIAMNISDATSVAITARFGVLASDIQTGDAALGYYYVTDTRSVEAYNRFAMGSSMVQDVYIFAGPAATITKVATANVPANQSLTYDTPAEISLLEFAGQASLATGSLVTDIGTPLLAEHVDIAHNASRELIVERTTVGNVNTIMICRNQVIG